MAFVALVVAGWAATMGLAVVTAAPPQGRALALFPFGTPPDRALAALPNLPFVAALGCAGYASSVDPAGVSRDAFKLPDLQVDGGLRQAQKGGRRREAAESHDRAEGLQLPQIDLSQVKVSLMRSITSQSFNYFALSHKLA